MTEALGQVDLNTGINGLKQVFSDFEGAVYLRGSLLRREPPYDDVDVVEIGNTPHDSNDVPTQFMGAKVTYRHLTPREWDEYLRDCPRSWYMFYDIAALRLEKQAQTTFDVHKDAFFARKEPDYVAYDHNDFLSSKGQVIDLSRNEYEYAKCIPGSKRSIMRSTFTLKALYPEYRDSTTPELLELCATSGKIPENVPGAVMDLYALLSREPVVTSDVSKAATKCAAWMLELADDTETYLQEKLPVSYRMALGQAALSDDPYELSSAHENMWAQNLAHRHWTLAYFLAKNPATPVATKEDIANYYSKGYVGRIIRDVLAERLI